MSSARCNLDAVNVLLSVKFYFILFSYFFVVFCFRCWFTDSNEGALLRATSQAAMIDSPIQRHTCIKAVIFHTAKSHRYPYTAVGQCSTKPHTHGALECRHHHYSSSLAFPRRRRSLKTFFNRVRVYIWWLSRAPSTRIERKSKKDRNAKELRFLMGNC